MAEKILQVFFWAILVNIVFLLFSLTRIFAAKDVHYGLTDLFTPAFYVKHPIFIALAIIGPVTFIADLMVFSAAGEITSARLGLYGLASLNAINVIFAFLLFLLVNILFGSETISTKVWLLLGFWLGLVVAGTITGIVILDELSGG